MLCIISGMAKKSQQPSGIQRALSKELVAASSEALILSILARAESYGYEIIQQVRAFSGGQLEWTDGMLYPVLHRLERQGLIAARWELSSAGRRRKYYFITAQGKLGLQDRRRQWETVSATLASVWEAKVCPT
jgi:DNA-binding PadR family transcriptional regulator